MKTYTTIITADIKGKDIDALTFDHVQADTPAELDRLKDKLWEIIAIISRIRGWRAENEGSMYITSDPSPDCDDCIFAKIYDDETGEEISLD